MFLFHRRGEGERLEYGINYDYGKPHTTFQVKLYFPIWISLTKIFHVNFEMKNLYLGRVGTVIKLHFRIRHKEYPGRRWYFSFMNGKAEIFHQTLIVTEEIMDDLRLKFSGNQKYLWGEINA